MCQNFLNKWPNNTTPFLYYFKNTHRESTDFSFSYSAVSDVVNTSFSKPLLQNKRNNEPINVDKPIYFWVLSLNIQNPTWHSIWNRDPSNSSLFHTSVRLWGWLTVLSARTGQLSSTTTTRITKILVASLCIKEVGWF